MMIKSIFAALFLLLTSHFCRAQFPYTETFRNATAPGLVISGNAKLTAATGVDVAGQGYLRLTDNTTNTVGYAYAEDSFPSNYGLTASFEFFSHKPNATLSNQADGMTFFLFDASVNAFRPGGIGGSLGYAQYYSVPGMSKGYIGISIDEFGNYSSPGDGGKNGGPGQQRGSIAVRGPGNGRTATDYVYQTGIIASDPSYNAGFLGFTQRCPDSTTANYRRVKVILTPGSSAGANVGYKVTVILYKGGSPVTPVTIINNLDYPFPAPAKLQFGVAASTGSLSNFHEVRSLSISPTNTAALVAPAAVNDAGVVACQGQQALLDVTANDASNNAGGTINNATVDLDPVTPGRQTTYTDAGKGTFLVDAAGVVTFSPATGYAGLSTASYTVNDNYGITSAQATITITVNSATGPDLVLANPTPLCAPAVVNITNPSLKTATTAGSVFDYFANLTDANNGANNINASAAALTQSGTYYIRAMLSGCATVKPVTVEISQRPTTAFAGADQNSCASTGGASSTLLATNPDVGVGAWTQVSGPAAANIIYPDAATSPVTGMAQGIYTFRWTTTSGACPASTATVRYTIGIPANAGANQTMANATGATLAANAPAPGTGLWMQISGPALAFANTSDPATSVSGMVPGNAYVLQWKITNGSCVNTSQVTLTNVINTIANAGPDRTLSSFTPFALAGNTPDAGNTGTWTIVSAPAGSTAALVAINSPLSSIISLNKYGDYTFRWTMVNGTFSNYDDVLYRIAAVLPLQLRSFAGQRDNGAVRLNWQTADEQSTAYFEVQRSLERSAFATVGIVQARGAATNNYVYTDASLPNVPSFYYRLKMVDGDGKATYSSVIKMAAQEKEQVLAVYDAGQHQIRLTCTFEKSGSATIRMMSAAGVVLKQLTKAMPAGTSQTAIEAGSLTGLQILFVELIKDGKSYRQKLMVY